MSLSLTASVVARVTRPSLVARPLLSLPFRMQSMHSSHSPMGTPVTGRKKVTLGTLRSLFKKREPITMMTAHDFPSAHVADAAGMDTILVGDSLAMVALGMEDTSEVLVEEMLLHCRSVARATKAAFTVSPCYVAVVPGEKTFKERKQKENEANIPDRGHAHGVL